MCGSRAGAAPAASRGLVSGGGDDDSGGLRCMRRFSRLVPRGSHVRNRSAGRLAGRAATCIPRPGSRPGGGAGRSDRARRFRAGGHNR
jgi:hypothetical protein